MKRSFDVIVLGCGTGGSRAAATAAAAGASVLAIDGAERLGGLCILRGCMPTKALLETAHRAHIMRDGARFGLRCGEPEIDFPAMMNRMRGLVERFRKAKVDAIERGGYAVERANARFVGPHTVECNGETFEAKAFVIATGSTVRPLDAPGVAIATSDDMFELAAPPGRALVIGGGAVGLEFAQWLARIGTTVTLSVRSPLLHATDAEFGAELVRALADEMEVCVPSTVSEFRQDGDAVSVLLQSGDGVPERRTFDLVLNAMGRVPRLEGLDASAAGIAVDRGSIDTNARQQTNVPHVFVAGDATGRRLILHEANREGRVAGANAAATARGQELTEIDQSIPPCAVTFTDPAFASVGRSRVQLERDGVPFVTATKRFPEQGRGIVTGARHGMLRLLAHPDTGKILGCQILNERADDLIHVPATAMTLDGTVERLLEVPWYHPTLAEAFIEVCRDLVAQRRKRAD